jgi:hypothetical protein
MSETAIEVKPESEKIYVLITIRKDDVIGDVYINTPTDMEEIISEASLEPDLETKLIEIPAGEKMIKYAAALERIGDEQLDNYMHLVLTTVLKHVTLK